MSNTPEHESGRDNGYPCTCVIFQNSTGAVVGTMPWHPARYSYIYQAVVMATVADPAARLVSAVQPDGTNEHAELIRRRWQNIDTGGTIMHSDEAARLAARMRQKQEDET